jgi:PAS domain S-box-containing protein
MPAKRIDNEKRFSSILDNINMGVVVHAPDTTIIMHNKKASELLGLPDEHIKGALASDDQWVFIGEDNRPLKLERFPVSLVLEKKTSIENLLIGVVHKDASNNIKKTTWVLANGSPVFNHDNELHEIIITFIDITDRKIAEDSLKKAIQELDHKKKELQIILEEAPNPIMIHTENGKVVLINKAWKQLTGYSDKEIDTIEKWTKKAYAKEKSVVKEYIDKLYRLDKRVDEGEYRITSKSGEILIWQFSSAPLGMIDGIRAVISSAMDVTELKQKDELMMSQSRLAAMGEMLSMIAHQWRQPLSVISTNASKIIVDIALDNVKNESMNNEAESILRQTQELSKTIDDFRSFFQPKKNKDEVFVKDIYYQALAIMDKSLKNNNIELINTISTHSKVSVFSRELMHVFINLLKNAQEALEEHRTEDRKIITTMHEETQNIQISICDNAGGIDKDVICKIFDPYFSTKTEKNGTGIGLYMSKIIIEEHLNGTISVSNKDEGTCVNISVPLNIPSSS